MAELKFIFTSWDDLAAQLRTAQARIERLTTTNPSRGANTSPQGDQSARMVRVFSRFSRNARTVTIECLNQGTTSARALGTMLGGIETLRGVNSQISALAKKSGLTYDELFVRDYSNYDTAGTQYTLTPEFRVVVQAAGATAQQPTPAA